jgi:predicted heme/steroid binding protein
MEFSELQKHNGKNGAKAYISCKGLVYDCSKNEVYCEGGGYNVFAGADATVSLATMEFKDVDKSNWRKLEDKQLGVLDEWVKWY